jgi:hypothetical protein
MRLRRSLHHGRRELSRFGLGAHRRHRRLSWFRVGHPDPGLRWGLEHALQPIWLLDGDIRAVVRLERSQQRLVGRAAKLAPFRESSESRHASRVTSADSRPRG